MKLTLHSLRARAFTHTLFPRTTLPLAFDRLGFVQADPIRAPARAQDLILRHRVEGYRAGDLEREYPALDIEEGYLYAYGFLRRDIWQLRHPPNTSRLSRLERELLAKVAELGVVHPDALRELGGRKRAVNAWGGYSTLAKLALENLHGRGLLRIARRENGIRLYEPCPPPTETLSPGEVFRRVTLSVANVLSPTPERSLRSIMARLARTLRGLRSPALALAELVKSGALERHAIGGVNYLCPAHVAGTPQAGEDVEAPRTVRILAPFDPLVWDRQRFEQLWSWAYRFEAYTPVPKRVRGYYAMPVAWGDLVIGWANVESAGKELHAELGFASARPRSREFRVQLDAELERLRTFLGRAGH